MPNKPTRRRWRRNAALWCLGFFIGGVLAVAPFGLNGFGDEKRPNLPDAGKTFTGPLPELTNEQGALARELDADIKKLCGEIGERNVNKYASLVAAAAWIEKSLATAGYTVERQTYTVKGREVTNLIAEIPGGAATKEIVVVGAHYDSVPGSPAADDNGSGLAALLATARALAKEKPDRTLRFVAFVNEEQPFFQEREMGSLHYAQRCRQRQDNVVAMLSLETLGYYTDAANSQRYPPPMGMLYPSTGNFIGFIANRQSEALVRRAAASFRAHEKFPSEWGALPGDWPGVGWSDHWSFWQQNYPAIMVTDTALYRNPNYHRASDKPATLDYPRMARVVEGLTAVIKDLAAGEQGAKSDTTTNARPTR